MRAVVLVALLPICDGSKIRTVDPLGFLFEKRAVTQQTRAAKIAATFDGILDEAEGDINVHSLLRAVKTYEKDMIAVGQTQSSKEMMRNVGKTESNDIFTTSMRTLLRTERDRKVHRITEDCVELNEQSCAIGLLWIRRSLDFQCNMFAQFLEGYGGQEAATVAYDKCLRPHHSWTLQRLYGLALKADKSTNLEWLAKLGGFPVERLGGAEMERSNKDVEGLLKVWRPLLARWKEIYSELGIEDTRRV